MPILLLVSMFSGFSQNHKIFEHANDLYNDGKYAESIDAYGSILDTGQHSAELYFNLANAHYKLNNIAPSIYYYEKALQLEPNDKDIKNNLAFAQNMTIDDIAIVPESAVNKLINGIAHSISTDGWAKLAIVLVFGFVIFFLVYYFSYSSLKKRLAFIGSITSIIIAVFALFLAFHKSNLDKNNRPAIVFSSESQVKSEPNSRSEESFRLHEGTKVQILDTIDDWKKIKLSDGKTGWVIKDDLKAL